MGCSMLYLEVMAKFTYLLVYVLRSKRVEKGKEKNGGGKILKKERINRKEALKKGK